MEDETGGVGELWSLRWCHFYGPTAASIYSKYCERGGRPVFKPSDSQPILTVLERLDCAARGSDYMRGMRINQYLSELMVEVMRESWHPEEAINAPKKMSVVDIKEYLDQNYSSRITLDELSTHFYINKYYLTRVFKEQYGQSITAYMTFLRITHAKQLLRFSDKTVEEIGLECGLGQLHYFSRVFKEIEGVPPSVYRSQW